jgi:hypothetical protein
VRRLLLLLCLVATAGFAGCGNSRTPVPNPLAPVPPGGFRTLAIPATGVSVKAPRSWAAVTGHAPLVAVISSGSAVIAVWRYPRVSVPPADSAATLQAQQTLTKRARARDPRLEVIASRVLRIGGVPAIELEALERISGQLRTVRSTHVFLRGAEVVLDEYAPPRFFAGVDREVFAPVARSLLVGRNVA